MKAVSILRLRSLNVILTAFALSSHPLIAQTTYTWTGEGSDNNWGTSANWTNGTPSSGNQNTLVFSGSTRTAPVNNLGDWSLNVGRMEFASGAASFTLSGNTFGFDPWEGNQTQSIRQNSSNLQTIGVSAFSFRSGADSEVQLNAGNLTLASGTILYLDSNADAWRQFYVTGTNTTQHTLTVDGTISKGGSARDPDIRIQQNKRLVVNGTLSYGTDANDGSLFVEYGRVEFGSVGTLVGRPILGANSGGGDSSLWLTTAGKTFANSIELGQYFRRTLGGTNESGTVTFSGNLLNAGSPTEYDLASTAGGRVVFSGSRNLGNATLHVNRPDGATSFGGTVVLSGGTNAVDRAFNIYAGVLEFGDFVGVMGDGTNYIEFNAASGNSGTFRYTGGNFTTTRRLWIDNSGITRAAIDISEAATTLTWNPSDGTRNQNLTKTGAGTLAFGGAISGGTVGVEQGTLILSANNSYAGGTSVTGGTLLVSASDGSAGGSVNGLGSGAVSIASGGQVTYHLSLGGSHTIANAFSLSGGTLHNEDGFNTYSSAITLASGTSTISARYGDTVTLSGGFTGSGNILFAKQGSSSESQTFVVSAAGNSTGTVRIDGVTNSVTNKLQIAHVDAFQTATLNLATADTGEVQFTVAGTNTYKFGGLSGTRNLDMGANSLQVGGGNTTSSYDGALTGTGGLTKVGNGTLTLVGSNGYSGATTVSAGTLMVTGSLTSTSGTTVQSGASIGGNGILTNGLALETGAQLVFNPVQTLTVNGGNTVFGGFSLANLIGFNNTVAEGTYTLLGGTTTFNYNNIANFGSSNMADIGNSKFAYFDGSSNLQVVVVPEPATGQLLLIALGLLIGLRLRQKAKA